MTARRPALLADMPVRALLSTRPLHTHAIQGTLPCFCLLLALLSSETAGQELLREVNVSATRTKEPLVESEPLKWNPRPSSDAAEFLRQKPEFSAAKIGGTSGTIFLRGLGGPRLGIVMNDSLEVSGANHGTDPATSYIQPDAHDQVTVVKGPNSVLYGSSMGGLVIFNELPKRFDKPGVQARLVGGLGSFGRRDFTADATVGTPLAQLRGIVNFSRGDNYKDGSGREYFSFFKRHSERLIATITPTKDISAEFSAESGDAQVAFPAFSLMGDGIQFKREILGSRFVIKDITTRFRKLEAGSGTWRRSFTTGTSTTIWIISPFGPSPSKSSIPTRPGR
jgi:iron complex outermembrane receptor protein